MGPRNMLGNPRALSKRDVHTLVRAAYHQGRLMLRKFGVKSEPAVYTEKDLESLAKFIYMAPMRVKVEHRDWLRLKDVDALHDYVLIRAMLEQHLNEVLPKHIAGSLDAFAGFLSQNNFKDRVPIIRHFPDYMNERVARIIRLVEHKTGETPSITLPFDSRGELRHVFGWGEDLEQVVERAKQDLGRYYEKMTVMKE